MLLTHLFCKCFLRAEVNCSPELDGPNLPVVGVVVEGGHQGDEEAPEADEIGRQTIKFCSGGVLQRVLVCEDPSAMPKHFKYEKRLKLHF